MSVSGGNKSLILVVGSSGLIGTALLKSLAPKFKVVGFDLETPDKPTPETETIQCDLTSDASVSNAFDTLRMKHGNRIASVVHLAAYYDFSGDPSPMYKKLTVEGTRRLLKNLQAFDVEQFVFSSSLLVMKPVEQKQQRLTESSPTEAEWDYPESKLEAERVIRRERGDIPAVILRIAGVYTDECRSLPIAQHIRRIFEKQQESYFFPGDADHGQPFIHLDDLVECIFKVIQNRHELEAWELFLIAEPDVAGHEKLQNQLGELIHGREWPTIRVPKTAAKAVAFAKEKITKKDAFIKPWMIDLADDHYPVEIERARRRLDWEPKHRVQDTLQKMVKFLRSDPQRWYEVNNLPVPDDLKELKLEAFEARRA